MDIDGNSVPAGVELFPQPKLFATKYLIDRRWDGNVLHSDEQGYLSGARGFSTLIGGFNRILRRWIGTSCHSQKVPAHVWV